MNFIDSYHQLRKIKKYSLRQKIRNAAIEPISFVYNKLTQADKLLQTPRIQFLYIHHVFSDESKAFENLILKLSIHHSFISHTDAINKICSGNIDKPYISISSDDGLKNNIRAARILDKFNIKGIFFICPDIIEEKDQQKIATFSKERLHFPPVEFMTWADIESLRKNGHEIGGHTMNHVNLAAISDEDAYSEIELCYRKIFEKCGAANHFAYPYGRFTHFNSKASKIVYQSGFESCSSAERGCHIAGAKMEQIKKEDLLVRRDHIALTWSWEQIQFFMLRNIKSATFSNNFYPYNANSNINQ